ncbi:hypothetical protein GF312_00220 [Candidatus Poribacteria bacterium]|nr:hypothetical protein [Candidatus Poribacteria bacterium]
MKKIIVLIIVLNSFLFLIASANDITIHLSMDGKSQKEALQDISTIHGKTKWLSSGGYDKKGAFEFSGDGDISLGERFPLKSSYTKTVWVFWKGNGGRNAGNNIISGDQAEGGHALWAPKLYGNKLSAGHNGRWNTVQDKSPLKTNRWYFVALAYDRSSGEMTLYKDGIQVSRGNVKPAEKDVTDPTISIGSFGYKNGYMFQGIMDDVRIYKRALNSDEIKSLYNNELAQLAESKLKIMTPEIQNINVDKNYTIKWRDSNSGDAIITWYYAEDNKGRNRKRIVTMFHDDFQNGATDKWEPRVNSYWFITTDPENSDNLVVRCETNNEYLGTVRRDFGDVVVSARMFGNSGGISVRYSPQGEPPSYRLRGNLRLWKRNGNTVIKQSSYERKGDWHTYEEAAWNLPDGSVALDGWVINKDGRMVARLKGVDKGQNGQPINSKPGGVALHDDMFDDVYVDPVSARFVSDKKNQLDWDTSIVVSGRYYIIAEVREDEKTYLVSSRHPIQIRHLQEPKPITSDKMVYGWGPSADVDEPRTPGKPIKAELEALKEFGKRVKGFVVWESNRTGEWEFYRINTDGTDFKQITQLAKTSKLPYRDYLRPRVSPDGKTILFGYGRQRAPVEVWVVPSDGGEARKLTVGNPLDWSTDGKYIYFVRDYQIWSYDISSGKESLVHKARVPVRGTKGSMVGDIAPDLSSAVFRGDKNEFFIFDQQKTTKTTGGCEPHISHDSKYMYWVQGPKDFRVWKIGTNEEQQVLGQPATRTWNYTYFPTITGNGRWLAYGASPNQHDHNNSDYEIYVQELKDWKPVGNPVRFSWDLKTDRWPYLYVK